MQATIEIVLPVFGMVLTGYIVGRTPLLSAEGIKGINNFVFYVAIPALLFRSMSTLEVPENVDGLIIPGFFIPAVGIFLAGLLVARWILKLDLDQAAIFGMGGTFGNNVLMGIPLILLAFGQEGLLAHLFIISFHPLIMVTIPTLVIEIHRSRDGTDGSGGPRGSVWKIVTKSLISLLKHPVIAGMLLGLAWGWADLGLWKPVETFVEMLKAAAGPAALFAVGATMTTFKVGEKIAHSIIMVAMKLLILPASVFVFCNIVFGVAPIWTAVATIGAAMPGGVNIYLLASAYDVYVARSTTAILISTAASVLTLGLLVGFLVPWVGTQ